MFSISTQIDIAVSPERVWRVLMDFAHYRNWHPHIELVGEPALGGTIDFYFRNQSDALRGWKGDAQITRLEPGIAFAYQLGIRRLCLMDQWYTLEPTATGTRVTYGSDFSGLLPAVVGKFLSKRFHQLHQVPLERLARGFVKANPPTAGTASKRPNRPRKGFRGYRS